MEVVLQISLLTVGVCLGAAALVRRTVGGRLRPENASIEVGHVSSSWLVEHRVRSRPD